MMKPNRFLTLCTAVLLLSSCAPEKSPAANTVQPAAPSAPANPMPEVVLPFPDDAETVPQTPSPVLSYESTPETSLPPETVPSLIEPSVPAQEPLDLPDGISTNITHPEAEEILTELYRLVSESADAAICFTDAEEEFFFGIDENRKYHSASTIKAAYCHYLISSGTDPSLELTFTSAARSSASGMLESDSLGKCFTVGELIEYTIRHSDNQAYRLLYDTFGTEKYNSFMTDAGAEGLCLTSDSEWAYVTPAELSHIMAEICRAEADCSVLTEHLKNTTFNAQIASGTAYETAHKYGYNGGSDGYHDTAIVYAPGRPYILTIMTHIDFSATDDPNGLFRSAAALCDRLHAILFGDG